MPDRNATSDQVDRILTEFKRHDQADHERMKAIYRRLDDHGETLARIDERTRQHEQRMDRADRRAGMIGSGAGVLIVAAVEGLKKAFGPHS